MVEEFGGEVFYEDEDSIGTAGISGGNLLTTVFKDGKFLVESTLAEIRARLTE